jgi:membrane associated rhomboid family serine protease
MPLSDRSYMRDAYHPPRWTTILIIVLLSCFVVQTALLFYGDVALHRQLALSVAGVSKGKVWQLVTFQFLHSSPMPWHVLFNCLGLYFFGRPVEEALGAKRFLWLYFLSGVAGGLLQVLVTILLPRHPDIPVVGASAGVCGLIAIFCSLNPMQELTTWLYFFPITIRARYFLMFLGLLSLFGTIIPFDYVAHAAHLGGILLGIGYVRWRDTFPQAISRWGGFRNLPGPWSRRAAGGPRGRPWRSSPARSAQPDSAEFMSREVDAILDKISAHGIHSLTEREQRVLDAARKRLGDR